MATRSPSRPVSDHEELSRRLARAVEGEVRFDATSRALYATDASNYRQVPIGVVLPRTVDDVIASMALCREFSAPVLPRGAGTSLSGQTCNVAVVFDFSKYMNRVLEVDPDRRLARVEPGVVLDDLRDAAEAYHLTFGPDPATHNRCTIGGMIGNNSCGVHSVMAGKTDANVISLDVLTYRGQRMNASCLDEDALAAKIVGGGGEGSTLRAIHGLRERYAEDIRTGFVHIPRRVSGFDLPYLLPENGFNLAASLVGTEGTCVTVLEATLRLVASPPCRTVLVLAYQDIFVAAESVMDVLAFHPIGLEGMDHRLIQDLQVRRMHLEEVDLLPKPPSGPGGWLLVEFGGDTPSESEDKARKLMDHLSRTPGAPGMRLCRSAAEAKRLWEVREAALGVGTLVPGKFMRWPGWDDSAVAPDRMAPYLRDLQRLMDTYDFDGAFYGHFGEGCLHVRYNFDFQTETGVAAYRTFLTEATDLVVAHGGSISGEHGDGQAHGELLSKMYSPRLMDAFRQFKAIWDPDWKMNPGKVLDANPLDSDLRLAGFSGIGPKTVFQFPDDGGSLSKATLRCVGVGKCRRHDAGTMCPSYMATREEMHSTRGRARLLFEMISGDAIKGGWRDEGVHASLDLCLACKACKTECPVGVDMATYKAEFLSHYYRRRLRPRAAYSMGLIWWWARLAAHAPGLVNVAGRAPVLSSLIKFAGGISPQRSLPQFAPQTFRRSHARGRNDNAVAGVPVRGRVVLWPDTFNNHFHPEVCSAALEVLRACGFDVTIPGANLCCGRPLYDFGMLDLARRQLRTILSRLGPEIDEGVPVVVLEPSCASVFRDELPNLFPDNQRALRLSRQTYLLAEFLEKFAGDFDWPVLQATAIMQPHCHQKSLFGMAGEQSLLKKLGVDGKVLDAGCCGMAGAFGFEESHFDISCQIGERALLPAVRASSEETVFLADGFSCREQITQLTKRRPIHFAELAAQALRTAKP